ncbi:MAG: HAD hydrolase family protein [Pseudomonadota bacterium]
MNQESALGIRLLALDVDGVLTDGCVSYTSAGEELKSFNIKDGVGIKLIQAAGVEVVIITGRVSPMVERRAKELGIKTIVQGREDKFNALVELCELRAIELTACAYMGDDLPDLTAIRAAGLGLSTADAADKVRSAADWCASKPGGKGAVREACEALLDARKEREEQESKLYG